MDKKFYWVLLLVLAVKTSFAQDVSRKVDASANEYVAAADGQLTLFYGKEPEGYARTRNHPYVGELAARLSYNGIVYPDVSLRLDLHRNELTILSPSNRNIILTPEKFDYAEFNDLHIIYLSRDNRSSGQPPTGYYFLLHSGKCTVLEKQIATLEVNTSGTRGATAEFYFSFSTIFYIHKDNVYHTIRNKRGLLKALHPHQKELRRYISSNKLRYRRDAQKLITMTVNEYERISSTR